jgi:hypothetical protein
LPKESRICSNVRIRQIRLNAQQHDGPRYPETPGCQA